MKYPCLTVVFFSLVIISCTRKREVPLYEVNFINNQCIKVDGTSDDHAWGRAIILKDFLLPWENDKPQLTIFRALYDTSNLYIFFQAMDHNMVIKDSIRNEIDISKEDRVELFISKNKTMDEYFCIEIDPLGRVLDYRASYYRKFDDKWNIDGILVGSKIYPESYQVEFSIPLKSLIKMGVNISEDFYVGLFRADLENSVSGLKENWLSWVDPKTPEPDFHVPQALGLFHFNYK